MAGMVAYRTRRSGSPGSLDVVLSDRLLAEQWLLSAFVQAPRVLRRFLANPLNTIRDASSIGPCGVLWSINVETLPRSVDIISNLSFFLGQDPPGWPGRSGHPSQRPLPTLGLSLRLATQRSSLYAPSLRNREDLCQMLGCWDLRIRRQWGDLGEACVGPSSGTPLSLSHVAAFQDDVPVPRIIQNQTAIPPLLCLFGLAKRYDKKEKNKLNNCGWTRS